MDGAGGRGGGWTADSARVRTLTYSPQPSSRTLTPPPRFSRTLAPPTLSPPVTSIAALATGISCDATLHGRIASRASHTAVAVQVPARATELRATRVCILFGLGHASKRLRLCGTRPFARNCRGSPGPPQPRPRSARLCAVRARATLTTRVLWVAWSGAREQASAALWHQAVRTQLQKHMQQSAAPGLS
jgi:hypothetical protein